ncbi:JAB domain-containing protein [Parasphingorhabdus sp.]|uniref:JAB domain-containing protein n=1 Tax=Parasphingorhabdus sp. TaxID=2709688 RepID=UPI003A936A9C
MDFPFHCRNASKSILAAMGSFSSDNRGGRSYRKAARRDHSPKSLYDHANSFFLSLVNRADDGHFLPSEKTEGHRDRHALAQLIEVVAPDEADRLSGLLLDKFGSIDRILNQSEAAIRRISGDNRTVAKLLKATEKFMIAKLRNELPRMLISATDQRLVAYLQARMGGRAIEIMRVLFLDSANRLLSDQEFGEGSPQRLFVQPRNIVKRALELDASAIILVHNHPGGSVIPSQTDIKFTRSIKALCLELEMRLHDHIIITNDHWVSFRKLKIL